MLSKLQLPVPAAEPLLIGVSGGADSVALVDALVQLGYRPHVAHLNHQWRGAASDADAEFVRALAGQYGLPVTIESRKVGSDEDAARQARLEFFESIGIPVVALAHTADDQVETFLMRLIRGAGTTGLAGILPDRQIGGLRVVRPLLGVRRVEIIEYLKSRQLLWREDSSNTNRQFLRNRVRHELLPLLEREYNSGIRDVLLRTAEILRAEAEGDPAAVARRAIRQLSFEQVEAIRQLAMGDEVSLPGGVVVYRDYDGFKLGEQSVPAAGGWEVSGTSEETFDADALGDGLTMRPWRDGDRFQPLGMTGEKKLQDFFVDEKVPRRQRGRVPLLCAADGRIAWVVGYRMAEPFKVTERTQRVLRIVVRG
jgi:tRNA(Ile)-lysidine synthase